MDDGKCKNEMNTLQRDIEAGKDKETLDYDFKNLKGCLSDKQ